MKREMLEWFHCEAWEGDKKVLLVGDSIIWGSHRMVEKLVPKGLAVTTVVTSLGVDEPRFVKGLDLFANIDDVEYELVYFNNGLHPHGQTADEYEQNYKKVVLELMKLIPSKKWMLGLSTPISEESGDPSEHSMPITDSDVSEIKKKNALVIEYNERVRKIADELGMEYYDAYTLMESKSALKTDPYHYNEEGRIFFAEAISNIIASNINKLRFEIGER